MFEVENQLLDDLYEGLPDEPKYGVHLYPARADLQRSEMYIEKDGVCYIVTVTEHSHQHYA